MNTKVKKSNYLSVKKFTDKNDNIKVNQVLFEKATLKIFKNHAATKADSLFKINLCDNLVTDEFIDTTDKLLTLAIDFPKKNPNMPHKDIIESLVSQMKLIQKTNKLSSASNLSGRHGILAGIIKNKVVMREEVLAGLKGGALIFSDKCPNPLSKLASKTLLSR